MTPVELLQFTYVRFKLSVLSLMLMISLFLFWNVFHHTVSLVALVYALVYIIVLNVGMRGASTRNVAMLRFYWVFQFVQLIVFLLTAVALAGFFTYVHVVQYQMHERQQVQPLEKPLMNEQTLTVGQVDPTVDPKVETVHKDVVFVDTHQDPTNGVKTTQIHDIQPACRFTNVLAILLPSLISLVVIFSVTRSIVLARQLINLLVTHADLADVELNACCQKDSCCKESSSEVPMTPVHEQATPIAVYVAPEGFVPENMVYPGQLMPVYVDKFGQPMH